MGASYDDPSTWRSVYIIPQTRFIAIVAVIFAFATGYTGMFEPMLSAGVETGALSIDGKETFPTFPGNYVLHRIYTCTDFCTSTAV